MKVKDIKIGDLLILFDSLNYNSISRFLSYSNKDDVKKSYEESISYKLVIGKHNDHIGEIIHIQNIHTGLEETYNNHDIHHMLNENKNINHTGGMYIMNVIRGGVNDK